MEQNIKDLILTLRLESWRESRLGNPNPSRHVALELVYDALVEHLGITHEDIHNVLEKAGL